MAYLVQLLQFLEFACVFWPFWVDFLKLWSMTMATESHWLTASDHLSQTGQVLYENYRIEKCIYINTNIW